jgi:predicted ribosomally synthesized peptide with SipW-like signal peptide
MKKAKFLVLVLVAAITLTGAGYAYWSDDVTIGGTVQTGTLETVFNVDDTEGDFNFVNDNINSNNADVATGNVSLNTEKDTATIIVGNLYPGVKMTKKLVIDNTGSIPVKLDTLIFTPTINSIPDGAIKISADLTVPGSDKLHIINALDPDSINDILERAKNYDIEHDNKVEIDIIIEVPTEVNDTADSENESFGFTVVPRFIQFNQ